MHVWAFILQVSLFALKTTILHDSLEHTAQMGRQYI